MNIEERLIQIIAEQAMLDPSDISLDSTFEDLGIDSIGLTESIFEIEEEFDVSIPINLNQPDNSQFDISNISTIAAGIEKLLAKKV
ncbi:MAG: phosphopantetheine-binding protein [Aestuariivita sp.]|nr:phosphopantetheine-binding protein [Aestuariivita sp.]